MEKNPFRGKPSKDFEQSVEDWGKTKFKPKKSGDAHKKPFKSYHCGKNAGKRFYNKSDSPEGNKFYKNNYELNQVARDAKPESATPWNKYKNEIIFKQREEEQAALHASMNSEEAKKVLKQREIIYRKTLIEQKKQEPIQWENFNNSRENNKNEKKKTFQIEDCVSKNKRTKNNLNAQSQTKFKKNLSNSLLKANGKEFISKDILSDFDSKKLSYKQNDMLRKVITKNTCLFLGSTLEHVKDIEHKKYEKTFYMQ